MLANKRAYILTVKNSILSKHILASIVQLAVTYIKYRYCRRKIVTVKSNNVVLNVGGGYDLLLLAELIK